MRQCDLRPGVRVKNGGVVFRIAQCNLFMSQSGRLLGGEVFPARRERPLELVKGYDALAVATNGRLTRARLTVE